MSIEIRRKSAVQILRIEKQMLSDSGWALQRV